MTDEGMGPFEEPTPEPEGMMRPEEMMKPERGPSAMAADFTSGEGLVALGGMVLLAVWLLFDVILDDYGLGILTVLLAAVVVIVPRLNPESVARVHQVPVIMKVVGYALGFIGVFDVIGAIEEGFFEDALTVIAALISYAAFAVAFIGARQIKI